MASHFQFCRQVCLTLSILLWQVPSNADDTIRARDFGLLPDSRVNAIPAVNQMIREASLKTDPVIVFERGRYDFWPQHSTEMEVIESNTTYIPLRRCAFVIENMHSLVIDGAGSSFIFHGKFQPFTVQGSDNIELRNFSIDWEIPFGAEAEIIDVADKYFDLAIDPCRFPYVIENDKLFFTGEGWKELWGGVKWNDPVEFDRETLEVTAATDDDLLGYGWESRYRVTELKSGVIRVHYENNSLLKKGNYIVLRLGIRDHSGIFIADSKDILLKNINMHSNCGMSLLAQYSENITCRSVSILPGPGRLIMSGHDDGLHFSNCKGLITIEGSVLKGLMDDGFNAHGSYLVVSEVIGENTILCRFPHHQSTGMEWAWPGDSVAVVNGKTMEIIGIGVVETSTGKNGSQYEIRFSRPLPSGVKEGDALENLTWQPDVTIRGCHFGNHRARGLLVSTRGKVLIENNIFETSGSAIVAPGDLNSYYESSPLNDVTIRENLFKSSCMTSYYMASDAIVVFTTDLPSETPSASSVHRNINVTENTFEIFDFPVLYAKSVDGIRFSNNRIIYVDSNNQRHPSRYNLTFDKCRNIQVKGNDFASDVPGRNLRLINTGRDELALDKKQKIMIITGN